MSRPLKLNTAFAVPVGLLKSYLDGKTLLINNNDFDPTDIVCELIKADGSSSELTLTKTAGNNNINLTGKGQALLTGQVSDADQAGLMRLSFTNAIKNGYSTEVILPFIEDFEIVPENVYNIAPATPANITDAQAAITNAIAADFSAAQKISLSAATPAVTLSDKTGFKLAADGLDSVTKFVQLWRRFFGKIGKTPTQIKHYSAEGILEATQSITQSGDEKIVGERSV